MTERPTSPTPAELLACKDGILTGWGQLPPEHQATMLLVLFQQTLEGEYGQWLRSAVKLMSQTDTEEPFRFLPVVSITPAHLERARLTEEEIARLDEDDLHYISHQIVQHYVHDLFWDELEFQARLTLAEKPTDT